MQAPPFAQPRSGQVFAVASTTRRPASTWRRPPPTPADRCAGPNGGSPAPGRAPQCGLHARPVRPGQCGRWPRLDLAHRRRQRSGQPVRQRDARRRAQHGCGARRSRVRQGFAPAVRGRPQHRHDPCLRSQRPGARPLRPRHAGSRRGRPAAGAVRSGARARYHQPGVQDRRPVDWGYAAEERRVFGLGVLDGAHTRSRASRCGRSRSMPARSAATRASTCRSRHGTARARSPRSRSTTGA